MKKIFFVFCGIVFFIVGCQPGRSGTKKDLSQPQTSSDSLVYHQKNKSYEAYWAKIDSMQKIKAVYFNDVILKNALVNKDLTETNKIFLKRLGECLLTENCTAFTSAGPEKLLFPIFTMKKNKPAIFTFSYYREEPKGTYADISIEHQLIQKTGFYEQGNVSYSGTSTLFPALFDSLYGEKDIEIYIFTDQKRETAKPLNLGVYNDECLEYYFYPISSSAIQPGNKILFGSSLPLDLVYENTPAIDSAIRKQTKISYYDCGHSLHLQVTFAKLKGVDDLYFTYADTFPLNDQLDTPLRGLIMKLADGSLVHLWYEEVDLFGCPCL